jgi:hypothetical protein
LPSFAVSLSFRLGSLGRWDGRQADDLVPPYRLEKWLEAAVDKAADGLTVDLDIRDAGRPLDLARRRGPREGDLDSLNGCVLEHAATLRLGAGRPYRADY